MTSFECRPLSLSSTICSCLSCFFVVYKPARVAMQYTKSPQVILALCLACCCMSSSVAQMGGCVYVAVVPEKKK